MEREELILKLLRNRGFVLLEELDKRLAASRSTVRRDLERLEGEGLIQRLRGGAKARADAPTQSARRLGAPLDENTARNPTSEAAIGRVAAQLCRAGEAIIIDGGSATLRMCPHLEGLGLQVLTNSLHIVSALLSQPKTRISVPAGTVLREQNIVLHAREDDGTVRYRASRMFLGAASVGCHGLMQADVLLLQAERHLIDRADELVLLVDSSKFEAPGGHVVCPLMEIDVVITDSGISDRQRAMLQAADIRVVIAES